MKIPREIHLKMATLTNLIHCLSMIQESYIVELEQELKNYGRFNYEPKMYVKRIKTNSVLMRNYIYNFDAKHAEEFEAEADKIEEMIKDLIKGLLD